MPKPIAVIAADMHVDELTWRDRPQVHSDAYWGMQQCVDLAIKRGVPLMGLGDVWEALSTTPNTRTISFMRGQIQRLKDNGLEFLTIAGNHDMDTPGWSYACGASEDNLDMELREIGGIRFFFLGYRPPHLLGGAMSQVPAETQVVLAHQHWRELGGGSNAQGKVVDFTAGEMLISGDLHEYVDEVVRRKDGESMRVISPGATCLRKANEPPQHYALVMYDDMSVKQARLKSRPMLRVVIESEEHVEKFCRSVPEVIPRVTATAENAGLPPAVRTPLLVVQDVSWIPGIEARLEHLVEGKAHLLYYRSNRATDDEAESAAAVSYETAEELLPSMLKLETGADEEVHDLLMATISSDNYRQTLTNFRSQFIER